MLALLHLGSKVNAVHLAFTKELNLSIRSTDVVVQKIDNTMLDTYEMVVAAFLVENKANQVRFFKETFLVTNVSLEVVLGLLFLTLNSVDIDFWEYKLR